MRNGFPIILTVARIPTPISTCHCCESPGCAGSRVTFAAKTALSSLVVLGVQHDGLRGPQGPWQSLRPCLLPLTFWQRLCLRASTGLEIATALPRLAMAWYSSPLLRESPLGELGIASGASRLSSSVVLVVGDDGLRAPGGRSNRRDPQPQGTARCAPTLVGNGVLPSRLSARRTAIASAAWQSPRLSIHQRRDCHVAYAPRNGHFGGDLPVAHTGVGAQMSAPSNAIDSPLVV